VTRNGVDYVLARPHPDGTKTPIRPARRDRRVTLTELCERFGISRKTGTKWRDRFRSDGEAGLSDRSRAPKRRPGRTSDAIEQLIVAERRRHPTWGPKKIRHRLQTRHGIESPPAASTVGDVLSRHGLIKARRRRPGVFRTERKALSEADRSNHVWAADYKGWFNLQDGQRCDPLTISDLHSRFIVRAEANPKSTNTVTV